MNEITVQEAITAFADWMEPTDAELSAIETEMPVILADVALVDAQITAMGHAPNDFDARRVRRALARVLAERAKLTNRTAGTSRAGGAA
ncbi:DUF6284 family protein [Streptomyces sp. NPDC088358]|uniref:DUF6284 family protein n=1 Tax=Streptomyces sp. NPDC088358 TaxID=3365857 RepID=UPI00380CAA96